MKSRLNYSPAILSRFCWLILVGLALAIPNGVAAQPTTPKRRIVVLEVSADSRAPIGTQQKWAEMLQDVGATRVTSKTGSNGTPAIRESEMSQTSLITVTGFIVGNRLKLPGGSFSIRDKAGIRELIQRLRDDGAKVALAEKKAFGLTSEQLVGVHEAFSRKVEIDTAGQNAGKIVSQLTRDSGLPFVLDEAARTALDGDELVVDELKGISLGTALALAVRPLGLVVVPHREQGKPLEIRIVETESSKENWPVGWPIETSPIAVEPKLFERIPIEIRGYSMKIALNAVQKKADVPFFYDQNTLARKGIELDEIKVTLVEKKASLMLVVSRLLRQSKPRMSEELRVDENGKAFLWISAR